VTAVIARELAREELPADTFGSLDPSGVVLAKTVDRSVLAHMTAMALLCEFMIGEAGGLAAADIDGINDRLRRDPIGTRGYLMPIELTLQRMQGERGLTVGRGPSVAGPGLLDAPVADHGDALVLQERVGLRRGQEFVVGLADPPARIDRLRLLIA
jgi:hypothetical protein